MRIILLFIFCIPFFVKGQTNTFPSSGNVGIGTTNPQAKLHLKNGAFMAGDPSYNNINVRMDGTSIPALKFTRWTGTASMQHNAFVGQFYNSSLGEYSFGIGTGYSTSGDQDAAITVLTSTLGGKVGIGTTTPQAKLDVNGIIQTYNKDVSAATWDNLQLWSDGSHGFIQSNGDEDGLYIKSNGANKIIMESNVGIGTDQLLSNYRLSVAGGDIKSSNYNNHTGISIGAENTERPRIGFHVSDNNRRFKIEFNGINGSTERLGFFTNNGGAWPEETEVFSISKTGNVSIGTTDPKGYKFAVNGDAIFTKIKVKQYSSWPDYVFEKDYHLPSLAEVEEYIQQHKHLPDVPSTAEVEKNGLDLGDNQAVLLKKIEELTLYAIEQNKRLDQLQEENKLLKKEMGSIKKILKN